MSAVHTADTTQRTTLTGPVLAGAAVAIMCMPCRRVAAHFVPTDELILADLCGRQDPHPIYRLAEILCDRRLTDELSERGVQRVLIVFDDLAVSRSWMLPPDAPDVRRLWSSVAARARRVLHGCELAVEVTCLSDLLAGSRATHAFDEVVNRYACCFRSALSGHDGPVKRVMSDEIAHRRRFAMELGAPVPGDIRCRAGLQLANYAAQGHLVWAWQASAYIPWTRDEVARMAIFTPRFTGLVTAVSYERVPTDLDDPTALAEAVIPSDHEDLRSSLPLYLRDLPTTPGGVEPGVAADILASIGKLLTPGLDKAGARELAALNQVLPGGSANRARASSLLRVLCCRGYPMWKRDLLLSKLFCHLASRYSDEALPEQARRNRHILARLAARVPSGVALALTASAATAPDGLWHPYLSDIDVMPLRDDPPTPDQVDEITSTYARLPRPAWLYLNTGASKGYGGLTRDPHDTLFAASELVALTDHEMAYLSGLTSRMRYLGGEKAIYTHYSAALAAALCRRRPWGDLGVQERR